MKERKADGQRTDETAVLPRLRDDNANSQAIAQHAVAHKATSNDLHQDCIHYATHRQLDWLLPSAFCLLLSWRNHMITSRERVNIALNHKESDRVPLDLGGSPVTGMQVDSVYKLRQALDLDAPGTPVKVVEPYQMLGEIKPDLMDALGIDVVSLAKPSTMFGFKNEGWKPWTTFAGTPVLVPRRLQYRPR